MVQRRTKCYPFNFNGLRAKPRSSYLAIVRKILRCENKSPHVCPFCVNDWRQQR
jgi:hypothetical protein